MEDGAVLGDVDVRACPHGVDSFPQAGPLGDGDEKGDGVPGQAVLGVVEMEIGGVQGERPAAGRVLREEVPEVDVSQLAVVVQQGLPFRGRRDPHGWDGHD